MKKNTAPKKKQATYKKLGQDPFSKKKPQKRAPKKNPFKKGKPNSLIAQYFFQLKKIIDKIIKILSMQ